MNTQTLTTRLTQSFLLASLLLLSAAVALAADATADGEPRLSATSQGHNIARGELQEGSVRYDEHAPMRVTEKTSGARQKPSRSDAQQKSNATSRSTANVDFWFYEADVVLFSDFDRDGYYYGIDLLFDVDTVYESADVFAVIYLSYDLGPWNEYAETEVFSIFGSSADDQYIVETELLSGYVTGDYDILIELYDTYDNALVASFGPEDSSELSYLPLEDASRDAPQETIIVVSSGGGGGAFTWVFLLALLGISGLRARQSAKA